MKALISPAETKTVSYIESWQVVDGEVTPVYKSIENCVRVAEVSLEPFDVAEPLFWIDCPEDCRSGSWYYKDGTVHAKPVDAEMPAQE